MPVVKSPEGKWMFDAGPHLVSISCHHRRDGACGGCYARLVRLTQALAEAGSAEALAAIEEMKAEKKRTPAEAASAP
jgi:hypothetical protein